MNDPHVEQERSVSYYIDAEPRNGEEKSSGTLQVVWNNPRRLLPRWFGRDVPHRGLDALTVTARRGRHSPLNFSSP
jgi:hypothetical protein